MERAIQKLPIKARFVVRPGTHGHAGGGGLMADRARPLRCSTPTSWRARLGESRRELFNLRFQLATGQLDNSSRLSHVRKDVARMLTVLRVREIGEAEGLALDDLPGHRAAARRRSEDEALGRDRTTASERRAKAKAEAAEQDDEGHDHLEGPHGDVDEDELADEAADDDGMARPDADEVDSARAPADEADADADADAEATS